MVVFKETTETRSQKRKRRGKALTISDPRDTIKAVHQAAALRKKSQSRDKDKEKQDITPTPVVNGLPEVDDNKNIDKRKSEVAKIEEKNKKIDRNRSNSGRFKRLEARPVRRSSISSVRKSDKTVKAKGKGYQLDGDALEEGDKKSPIKVPPPSPRSGVGTEIEQERISPVAEQTKKLVKSKSAEEAIKGAKEPNGDEKAPGKKRPTLDKLHMLGK